MASECEPFCVRLTEILELAFKRLQSSATPCHDVASHADMNIEKHYEGDDIDFLGSGA